MSLLRPFPDGTTHELNEDGMKSLPPFVRARLQYLADVLEWHPDEGEDPRDFTYYEVRGRLSDGYYTRAPGERVSSLIQIWIASDDELSGITCHKLKSDGDEVGRQRLWSVLLSIGTSISSRP
jgi:hypothetical protein